MGRAAGVTHVLDVLRRDPARCEVVETGGDGAAWAAPVLALPPDGRPRPPALPVTPDTAVDAARALLRGQPGDPALREFFGGQTRRLLARAGQIDPWLARRGAGRGRLRGPQDRRERRPGRDRGRGRGVGPAWSRRRVLSRASEVARRARRRRAQRNAHPRDQRRGGRAGRVQGSRPHGGRPPPPGRGDRHRRARDRRPHGLPLHQRAGRSLVGTDAARVGPGRGPGRRGAGRGAARRDPPRRRRLRLRRGDGHPWRASRGGAPSPACAPPSPPSAASGAGPP